MMAPRIDKEFSQDCLKLPSNDLNQLYKNHKVNGVNGIVSSHEDESPHSVEQTCKSEHTYPSISRILFGCKGYPYPEFHPYPTFTSKPSKNGRHKLYASKPVECGLCKRNIENKYLLHAIDKYWHEKCLKCDFCRKPLYKFGTRFYFRQGAKFCQDDFLRTFGGRGVCSKCDLSIAPTEYVLRFKGELTYHLDCFKCYKCDKRFCVGDMVRLSDPKSMICKSCDNPSSLNHNEDS